MKKVAIAAGVIIAAGAVWTGSSWYLGTRIQQRLDDHLVKTNEYLKKETRGRLSVEAVRYHRGVFSSDASYKLNLNVKDLFPVPAGLLFKSHIEHGPISLNGLLHGKFVTGYATATTTLLNNGWTQPLYDAAGGKEPYVQNDSIDFSGNLHSIGRLVALDAQLDKIAFKTQPATITSSVDKDFTRLDMTLDIPEASITGPDKVNLVVKNVTAKDNLSKSASDYFLGPAQLKFGAIQFHSENGKMVSVADFQLHTDSKEVDGFLNLKVGYDIGKTLVDNVDFGAIKLNLAFDHVDPQALEKFTQQVGTLSFALDTPDPRQEIEKVGQYYGEFLANLIRKKLQVHVSSFSWKTAGGEGSMSISASFDGRGQPGEPTATGLKFLSESLKTVDFGLKVDSGLIRDLVSSGAQLGEAADKSAADMQGEGLASMAGLKAQMSGLGKFESGVISSDIAYDSAKDAEEKITLNGESMSLEALFSKARALFADQYR